MSVLRTVLPMDATCIEWLDLEGVSHPEATHVSRLPTPHEVAEALRQLPGYVASVSADLAAGEWSAQISSTEPSNPAWASLLVSDYSSDDRPHEFYFPKGWPEVVFSIVERLTHICGPLVVADDSGSLPVVVRPNDSVAHLIRHENVA